MDVVQCQVERAEVNDRMILNERRQELSSR